MLDKKSFVKVLAKIVVILLISSCGGSSEQQSTTSINKLPVSNAGQDQIVEELTDVILSGSGTDIDGSITHYQWTQTSGTEITLVDNDKATASFSAPDISVDETLTFQLTVTDNDSATHSDSVDVSIIRVNQLPVSNAGQDQIVEELTDVILSGSGTDIDGSITHYQWTQTSGTEITLVDNDKATASFSAPDISVDETLTFQLVVTDNDNATHSDSVNIAVINANTAPTADAGGSQFVTSGEVASLDSSASTDLETAILAHSWLQIDSSGLTILLDDINAEQPSFTVPTVTSAQVIIFEVTVTDIGGLSDTATVNVLVAPELTQKMNDTGVILCANVASWPNGSNSETCSREVDVDGSPIPDGQDGHYGRDVNDNYDLDGKAGFSFTKLDSSGAPLPVDASDWGCVLDNVTGLVWEVKSEDSGLQDKMNTYTWYNPDSTTNGGDSGTIDGGNCNGSACDTNDYTNTVNEQNLCGASDWRVPTEEELTSIIDYSIAYPRRTIDTNFFPNTYATYWTSSTSAHDTERAWSITFGLAYNAASAKGSTFIAIRLVREHTD